MKREKWRDLDKERFNKVYAEKHVPVLLEDVCHMPAVAYWNSFDYFLKQLPKDKYVDVSVSESTFSGEISNHREVTMRFDECMETMKRRYEEAKIKTTKRRRNMLRYYLCQCPLSQTFPSLIRDVRAPPFLDSLSDVSSINLWCAGDAVTSSLHYDENHNILIVTRGQKRVKLYNPSCKMILPNGVSSNSGNHARFREASCDAKPDYIVDVKKCTALFIPEGWYHEVESSPGTIGLNMWFEAGLRSKIIAEPRMLPFYIRVSLREVLSRELQQRLEKRRKLCRPWAVRTEKEWKELLCGDMDGLTGTMLAEDLDAMSDSGKYTKSDFDRILGDDGAEKLLSMRESYSKLVLCDIIKTYNIY